MDPRVLQFVEQASNADDVEALNLAYERILAQLGFDRFAYSLVKGTHLNPEQMIATTYPQNWVEHYIDRDYANVDPVVHGALTQDQPFQWSENRAGTDARALFDEAKGIDIKSGLAVPIPIPGGGRALMSISCPLADDELSRMIATHGSAVQLVTYAYHQAASTLLGLQTSRLQPLPLRTSDILRWLAAGKSVDDIAAMLFVPSSTVTAHLQDACWRLGVNNVVQLVAEAARRGFI